MKYLDDIRGRRPLRARQPHASPPTRSRPSRARYDPQPFHLDEAAAARSHFGALCASGWHTAAIWMRLMVDYRTRDGDAARARGEPVAALGPSPGFRELKWLKPVYVGDTITYATEVIETRAVATAGRAWG